MQNKILVYSLIIINTILVSVAGFFSWFFGVTGYTYFGLVAVPLTSYIILKSLNIKFSWILFFKVLFYSLIMTFLAYSPLLLLFLVTLRDELNNIYIFLPLSIFILLLLTHKLLPKLISTYINNTNNSIDNNIKINLYPSAFLTSVSIMSLHIFIASFDLPKTFISSVAIFIISSFLAQVFYVKSYIDSFVYKKTLISKTNKYLEYFAIILLFIFYMFAMYVFSETFSYPTCC